MNNNKRKWWLISLISVVIILIVIAYIKGRQRPKGIGVTTELVTTRDIKEVVTASGKIFPENEVKISSDVSGEIIGLYVKEGDTVKAGQLLAKINPDSYLPSVRRGQATVKGSRAQELASQSQIKMAQAQLDEINSRLENTRKTHNRNTKLYADGVISKSDLEASQSTLDGLIASANSAKAAIKQAQTNASSSQYNTQSANASLDEMKTSLNKTFIYAPVDGIISSLKVEKGERVVGTIQMSGTEMMTIANLSAIEAQVEVSENDIVRVHKGDSAVIEIDAFYGKKFTGVVTEIANSSTTASSLSTSGSTSLNSDQVTNFIVKVRLNYVSYKSLIKPDEPFPFRPGMSVSVEINTKTEKNVLAVPIQSVTTRENPSFSKEALKNGKKADLIEVAFIQKGDSVNMIPVQTGIQDDEYIYIKQGLQKGDRVVSGPYSAISRTLKQGDKVYEDKKDKTSDTKEEK